MVRSPQQLVMPFAALSLGGGVPSISLVPPTASPASPIVTFNTNPELLAIPGLSRDSIRSIIDSVRVTVVDVLSPVTCDDLKPIARLRPCLKRRGHVKPEHRPHPDGLQSIGSSPRNHSRSSSPKRARPTKIPRPVGVQWSKQPHRPHNVDLSTIGETEELSVSVETTMNASRKWEHRHFALTGGSSTPEWRSLIPGVRPWDDLASNIRIRCEVTTSVETTSSSLESESDASSRKVRFADEVGRQLLQFHLLGDWFGGDDDFEPSSVEPESSEFSDSDDDDYMDMF